MKVLVVDDNVHTVENISEYLEIKGHESIKAFSVEEAVKQIQLNQGNLDLAIIDMRFPDDEYGGFAIKRYLNGLKQKIPTAFITGLQLQSLYRDSRELGSIALISKPFGMEGIEKILSVSSNYSKLTKSREITPIASISVDLVGEITTYILSSTFTIGRGKNNNLVVPSYFEYTSSLHCMMVRVYQEEGERVSSFYRLVDGSFERSSRNGLLLNEKRLLRKIVDLRDGDIVKVPLYKKEEIVFATIYYELIDKINIQDAKSTLV